VSVAIRLYTVHGIDSGGVDWIDLAQDRDNWRAVVTTAMNLRFPLNVGHLLGEELLASQERLCTTY